MPTDAGFFLRVGVFFFLWVDPFFIFPSRYALWEVFRRAHLFFFSFSPSLSASVVLGFLLLSRSFYLAGFASLSLFRRAVFLPFSLSLGWAGSLRPSSRSPIFLGSGSVVSRVPRRLLFGGVGSHASPLHFFFSAAAFLRHLISSCRGASRFLSSSRRPWSGAIPPPGDPSVPPRQPLAARLHQKKIIFGNASVLPAFASRLVPCMFEETRPGPAASTPSTADKSRGGLPPSVGAAGSLYPAAIGVHYLAVSHCGLATGQRMPSACAVLFFFVGGGLGESAKKKGPRTTPSSVSRLEFFFWGFSFVVGLSPRRPCLSFFCRRDGAPPRGGGAAGGVTRHEPCHAIRPAGWGGVRFSSVPGAERYRAKPGGLSLGVLGGFFFLGPIAFALALPARGDFLPRTTFAAFCRGARHRPAPVPRRRRAPDLSSLLGGPAGVRSAFFFSRLRVLSLLHVFRFAPSAPGGIGTRRFS